MDIIVGFIALGVAGFLGFWLWHERDEETRQVYPAIVLGLFATATALLTWPGDRLIDMVQWVSINPRDHPMFWTSAALIGGFIWFNTHKESRSQKQAERLVHQIKVGKRR